MSLPLFISKKYIRTKKETKFLSFISIISIAGIALGVAVVIIALTILSGFEDAITEKIIKFNSHIKISAFSKKNLPNYHEELPQISRIVAPHLHSISPFVSKYAIIQSKNGSEGIELTGISPKADNLEIESFIIEGKLDFEKFNNLNNIVIGKKLADKLYLNLNDKVTIFTLRGDALPSYENPPAIKQFIVKGIYESGMADYDDLIAYVDINVAQNLFEIGNEVSGYNIKLNDLSKADSLSQALQDSLRYPYYVRTIFKVHQNIFTWLDLQKKPIPIILGLIIIVAVFNVVGTLLMVVLEKTNAIGILKSLGATKKQVIKIFVYQGIYLAAIGILIGNILAFILSIIQRDFNVISLPDDVYFVSSVPISVDIINYLLVSFIAFALSLAATFIPSFVAAKVQPISAIRFD